MIYTSTYHLKSKYANTNTNTNTQTQRQIQPERGGKAESAPWLRSSQFGQVLCLQLHYHVVEPGHRGDDSVDCDGGGAGRDDDDKGGGDDDKGGVDDDVDAGTDRFCRIR